MGIQTSGGVKAGTGLFQTGSVNGGKGSVIAAGRLEPVIAQESVSVIGKDSGRGKRQLPAGGRQEAEICPCGTAPQEERQRLAAVKF